ncbi:MAG: pitrilysin family protein [Proteobacteria bacterium]|nr:pitrilysin family protein [Pseudomonadota bacterium]
MRFSDSPILLFFLTLAAPALANDRTHEFMLDNGLKLIVQEDHRAPVAVVQVWYKIGSSFEYDGITGVSHALEHMMFKGTEKIAPGAFSEIVAAKGGDENAFTSTDYTAYFQTWAAENVGLSFELEADRMRNLLLSESEFKSEIKVVLEERRLRTDDNPQALLGESAHAVAFQTSPYRQPVIGWAADIQAMDVADLKKWYQRWYAPDNATVVVVGDVDPAAVNALAIKHFGSLKRESVKPTRLRPEVEQHGKKTVTVTSDKTRVPYLYMGYKTPVLNSVSEEGGVAEWEIYALDVLSETLDGGPSARLTQRLIRDSRIAAQVSASYSSTSRLPDLFSFSAAPAGKHTLEAVEQAIIDEIEKLQKDPPSNAELERIKTQVVADSIYERDSIFYQGLIIGTLESVGLDWRLNDEYVANIKRVTPDQVREVAKKYLVPSQLTVAKLLPGAGE